MLSKDDLQLRLQMKNNVLKRVREFFVSRGFLEIEHPPIITQHPGQEPNLDPMEVDLKLVNPSRNVKAGLITSPEYAMKKLMGAGMEKIFTITPVFRNMEANSQTNAPEFLMLEWYAPGSYDDLMDETENLLKFVLEDDTSWSRLRYEEAKMVDEEPNVDEKRFFITHYPAEKASLAKVQDGYAERFEAFANSVISDSDLGSTDKHVNRPLELCNGFCELTDPQEQRRRFQMEQEERRQEGKTVFPIDEELLKSLGNINKSIYGNALGIDRLIMVKYGIADINQVQIFPFQDRY